MICYHMQLVLFSYLQKGVILSDKCADYKFLYLYLVNQNMNSVTS